MFLIMSANLSFVNIFAAIFTACPLVFCNVAHFLLVETLKVKKFVQFDTFFGLQKWKFSGASIIIILTEIVHCDHTLLAPTFSSERERELHPALITWYPDNNGDIYPDTFLWLFLANLIECWSWKMLVNFWWNHLCLCGPKVHQHSWNVCLLDNWISSSQDSHGH